MSKWDVGFIFPIGSGLMWAVVTSKNYRTKEITARYFDSYEAADKWVHEGSKAALPEWHKAFCTHHGCGDGEEV